MISREEKSNKRKGLILTIIAHTILIILMILPFLSYPDPPPGAEGVLVSLSTDLPSSGGAEFIDEEINKEESASQEEVQEEVEEQEEPIEEDPIEEEVIETPKEVITNPNEQETIPVEEPKEDPRKKEQEEAERKRKEDAERKLQEEIRKEQEANQLSQNINNKFNKNTSKNKDNVGSNSGPSSDNLSEFSSGKGEVGGGLAKRGVKGKAPVSNSTTETGVIVVKLCVDKNGKVIPSTVKKTQMGSTSSSQALADIAIANAKRWSFASSSKEEDCGTITYNFQVKS